MGTETRPTCRNLNGEVDDERQRGAKGKRRRYFLAAVVRREQDSALRRLHVHSLRQPETARRPSNSRLSLPVPAFMPLTEELRHPGDCTRQQPEQENRQGVEAWLMSWRAWYMLPKQG